MGSIYACAACGVVHYMPERHPEDADESCGVCNENRGWVFVG